MLKGQSRYLVGVAVMVFAVAFYSLSNFAVEYVLQTALEDMEENYDRYESAVHSYMIVNGGVNGTSNVINQTEMGDNLIPFSGYSNVCYFGSPHPGVDHGDKYKIYFTDPYDVIKSGECSRDSYNTYPGYGYGSSYGVASLPSPYPIIQFWGVANGGQVFSMQTRVE